MNWTKAKPTEPGWYWNRRDRTETPEIVPITRNDDGGLVIGSGTIENGIHREPRKVGLDMYPDEQWSDQKIPEPVD
jgi:hypothetical protein